MPPAIRGILVHRNRCDWFRVCHGFVEVRLSQAASKFQETGLVVRWIVAQRACQRDHPVAALDGEDDSPAFVIGWSSKDEQRLPIGGKLGGAAIDARGVSNIDF